MFDFKFIYFILFTLTLYKINGQISDKRLCVDEKCQEPVSLAKTLLRYSSPDPRILSFLPNVDVKIFSKEAGSRTDLWGAEINGKRGYVPKIYIRESKVLKTPTILVDTELKDSSEVPSVKHIVQPDNVKEPYEVIDGTTIYNVESVDHSTNKNPSHTTELPSNVEDEEATEKGGVQEMFSSFKNWINDEIRSVGGDDGVDDDDDDFTIDDENEAPVVEDAQNEVKLTTDAHKGEKENQIQHEVPQAISVIDVKPELSDPIHEKAKLVVQENEQPAKLDPILDKKEEQINKQVQTKNLVENENMEFTTPSFSPDDIPSSSIFVEAITQNPLENQESEKTDIPKNYGINDEVASTLVNQQFKNDGANIPVLQDEINTKNTDSVGKVKEPNISASQGQSKVSQNVDVPHQLPHSTEKLENLQQTNLQESRQTSIPINDGKSDVSSILTNQQSVIEGTNIPMLQNEIKLENPDSVQKAEEPNSLVSQRQSKDSQNLKVSQQLSPSTEKIENLEQTAKVEYTALQDEARNSNGKVDDSKKSEQVLPSIPQDQLKIAQEPPQLSPLGGLFNVFKSSQDVANKVVNEGSDAPETNDVETNTFDISKIRDLDMSGNSDATADTEINISGTRHLLSEDNTSAELGAGEVLSDTKFAEDDDSIKSVYIDISKIKDSETVSENSSDSSDEDLSQILLNEKENHKDKSYIEQKSISRMQEDIKKQNENNDKTENYEIPLQEQVMDTGKMSDDRVQQEILTLQDEAKEDLKAPDGKYPSDTLPEESGGIFSSFMSWFGSGDSKKETQLETYSHPQSKVEEKLENVWVNQAHEESSLEHCDAISQSYFNFNSNMFLYLVTSAISCIIFLFVYMAVDRSKKEVPLIARINKLEKELLVALKENEMLQDKNGAIEVPEEVFDEFKHQLSEMQVTRDHMQLQVMELEMKVKKKDEQIESLEKELETSTEVGMELNRIISEMLDPTNGNDRLKENFDQLQRQLLEQKDMISTMTQSLNEKEAENTQLQLELEASQKFAADTQKQLNKLLEKLVHLEKEHNHHCSVLQGEIAALQRKVEESITREEGFTNDIQALKNQLSEAQRQYELKTKEYIVLKENVNGIKLLKQGDNLQTLLDSTAARAQLEQLKVENERFSVQLQQEQMSKANAEQNWRTALEEISDLQQKYELADKEKTEGNMKLEVLNNYFKKRETELQEEVIKYKSIFDARKGEATSTTERIKLMQEEIENYKSQNEMLKQEILSQEIDLKSQISVLEKKVHENWLMSRQAERKLEEARQEAAQLRNRLTLREMAINEERIQNRLQSPVTTDHHHHGHHQQNGDAISPPPPNMSSPPPLFGAPSAASPPLPGGPLPPPPFLPHPFMPPPPMPFMPPPPPPGPPGDRRPPPLGRMSSPPPPINSRYSPDTSAFSPYDRYSPSPPYDSEYGASPPPLRAYSPFTRDDRRDAIPGKRAQHNRSSNRHMKGGVTSSGSEHSNDSVDKINRKPTKMV